LEEKQLIQALRNSDESAFRELVEKYELNVYNTCIGMLGDEDNAKDISQDVFIEVFRSIHKFRGDSKISTWLYRLAVNKSLNHIRDNKKHRIVRSIQRFFIKEDNEGLDLQDFGSQNAEQEIEQSEHSKALHQALNKLPENQKTAFVLKNYDDLSYKQISEIMELSHSSVESLIHRAKVNLQKHLEEYYLVHFR
jgi:RNA polymerase sigma-70 factor (ECF subfamily)